MPVVSAEGYQHSLSELRDYIRSLVQEPSGNTFWKDDDLDKYIQLTLDDMRMRGVVVQSTYSDVSTADMQTFVPPPYVWKITRIDYDDERLKQITEADLDLLTGGDWDANSGTPQYWYDDGSFVRFDKRCGSAGKTINVYYWERPADISGDSSLSGLYKVFTPCIVYGALYLAYRADKSEMAGAWKADYEAACQNAIYHSMKPHESDWPEVHDRIGW